MKVKRHANGGLRKVCSCPRRHWSKCPHPWHFSFKWQGTHHRFSLDRHAKKHIDSKTDASSLADEIRIQIRSGKFGQAVAREDMTLRQLADLYMERYIDGRAPATSADSSANETPRAKEKISPRRQAATWAFKTICGIEIAQATAGPSALGSWRVSDIVTDSIERFREVRHAKGAGVVAVNRNLALLRSLFNWAIRVGYLERTPFKRQSETVITLSKELPRHRRLEAKEEAGLLAAAAPHLHAVVVAALESGMRKGEILSLQVHQVEGWAIEDDGKSIKWAPRAEIFLPAGKTKTKRDRRIPLSGRLRAVLEMRRFDPSGQPLATNAYLFGNVVGQRVNDVGRAWDSAVLKAHGHVPMYAEKQIVSEDGETETVRTANLSRASRATLASIDLHFHDLRREAGSRWMDAGVPLATIQRWLGHTNISQTSTYLAGTAAGEHEAMRRFEEHQAALQSLATESETGGRKGLQAAVVDDNATNKTAVGSQHTIM